MPIEKVLKGVILSEIDSRNGPIKLACLSSRVLMINVGVAGVTLLTASADQRTQGIKN